MLCNVKDNRMIQSAGKVSIAIMFSRILGLIRDVLFASLFGVRDITDAFFMAYRLPNLLRDLFAEGALSTAFVTVFSKIRAQSGADAAWKLARKVSTLQFMILGILILIGIAFAPTIIGGMAPEFARIPGKLELTINLARILCPFILFVAMAALSMGMLNAFGRFGLPASASSFFNLGSIIIGFGTAYYFDPHFGITAITCMAVGTLCGGVLQWLVQVFGLRQLGYRFRPDFQFKDPALYEIGRLMGPAAIGASAVQVNVFINSIFASKFTGGVAMLALAFRLIQLPIGLFGVSISTATLPSLAVDATQENKEEFRRRIEQALRLNAALCMPAAAGLCVLSIPMIGLIYEHWQFDYNSTLATARVLIAYSLGLVGYASLKILSPAFYALGRPRVPMLIAFGSILLTYSLNWFFAEQTTFGPAGLALTTSIIATFSALLQLSILSRSMGRISPETWKAMGKIAMGTLAMIAVLAGVEQLPIELNIPHGFFNYLLHTLGGIFLGGAVYLSVIQFLKLEEVNQIRHIVLSKLGWFQSRS